MEINYHSIAGRIGQLNILHRIYIHRAAAEYGVYFGQHPILDYLSEHDQCTQKELAEMLQVSPPSIATSIKRMQKTGLLKKATDESDLRCNRISLTDKGRELFLKSRAAFDAVDARMFQNFNTQDCDQFCGYLNRMIANMESDEFKNKTMLALIDTMTAEKKRLNEQKGEEIND